MLSAEEENSPVILWQETADWEQNKPAVPLLHAAPARILWHLVFFPKSLTADIERTQEPGFLKPSLQQKDGKHSLHTP